MKYKAILSDLDGTLVQVGSQTLSPHVEKAIEKSFQIGVPVVLITGRSMTTLDELSKKFNYNGLIIFDNGAGIYNVKEKRIIWESLFNAETANEILALIKKYNPKDIGLATSIGRIVKPEKVDHSILVRKLRFGTFSPQLSKNIIKEMQTRFPSLAIVEASSIDGPNLYDIYITNADATKQHAIVKLSEILKIPTEEMIGIGDHYNDFPLLMACGLKVAMGNAVPELKAIADYIAPSVDEDGVADVIEKFILNPS